MSSIQTELRTRGLNREACKSFNTSPARLGRELSINTSFTVGTEASHDSLADFKYQESTGSRHGVPMPKNRTTRYKRLKTAELKAKEEAQKKKSQLEREELKRRKEHYKSLP